MRVMYSLSRISGTPSHTCSKPDRIDSTPAIQTVCSGNLNLCTAGIMVLGMMAVTVDRQISHFSYLLTTETSNQSPTFPFIFREALGADDSAFSSNEQMSVVVWCCANPFVWIEASKFYGVKALVWSLVTSGSGTYDRELRGLRP